MRRWIVPALLVIMLAIMQAVIGGWLYIKHMDEVEAQKRQLWQSMTGNRHSNLAECLDRKIEEYQVRRCMRIHEAITMAFGR